MMVHGYCEKCKRIRRVTLNTPAVLALAFQGVAVGVCAECEGR